MKDNASPFEVFFRDAFSNEGIGSKQMTKTQTFLAQTVKILPLISFVIVYCVLKRRL